MEIRRPFPVLLVSLVIAAGALAACGGSDEPSGTVNQPISVGTAEEELDPSGGTGGGGEETAAGGEEVAGDPAAGKEIFTANCASCHTLADAGTSGTVGPNLDDVKPPAPTVVEVVTNGRGAMPAFGGQLSEEDIANVAAYVSSATGAAPAEGGEGGEDTGGGDTAGGTDTAEPNVTEPEGGDTTPVEDTAGGGAEDEGGEEPAETTDAAAGGSTPLGKELFTSAGCVSCHTLADAGATGTVGPNLDEAQPSVEAAAETIANGRGAMPAFAGQLSEEEIQEIAAYVSAVAGG